MNRTGHQKDDYLTPSAKIPRFRSSSVSAKDAVEKEHRGLVFSSSKKVVSGYTSEWKCYDNTFTIASQQNNGKYNRDLHITDNSSGKSKVWRGLRYYVQKDGGIIFKCPEKSCCNRKKRKWSCMKAISAHYKGQHLVDGNKGNGETEKTEELFETMMEEKGLLRAEDDNHSTQEGEIDKTDVKLSVEYYNWLMSLGEEEVFYEIGVKQAGLRVIKSRLNSRLGIKERREQMELLGRKYFQLQTMFVRHTELYSQYLMSLDIKEVIKARQEAQDNLDRQKAATESIYKVFFTLLRDSVLKKNMTNVMENLDRNEAFQHKLRLILRRLTVLYPPWLMSLDKVEVMHDKSMQLARLRYIESQFAFLNHPVPDDHSTTLESEVEEERMIKRLPIEQLLHSSGLDEKRRRLDIKEWLQEFKQCKARLRAINSRLTILNNAVVEDNSDDDEETDDHCTLKDEDVYSQEDAAEERSKNE